MSARPQRTTDFPPPPRTGRVFMKINIWIFFENLSRKFKFLENLTSITGTLYEGLCTYTKISRYVILRMKNVSDRICRRNQDKHFMPGNHPPPPKIVPFMIWCWKIWQSVAGHIWQCNTAHTLCMLGNQGKHKHIHSECVILLFHRHNC